nr:type II secretion system protein GspL [Pseudomonas cichorii]
MRVRITQSVLLESVRYKLSEQWQRSILPRFFNWWATELIACLPAGWRTRLCVHRKPAEVRWPLQAPWDSANSAVVRLVLAAEEVWPCELELPKQAAQNLRSVVSYELDKHTPFTYDQIYFDVKSRPAEQRGLLQVSLVVIDRPRLDKVLLDAQALGLEVAGVDALGHSGQTLGLNLMPHSTLTVAGKRLQLIRYGLCAAILFLLISIPATLIREREQRLEDMRQELTQLRMRAIEVDGMRKQLIARDETEKTLNSQSNHRQTTLALLEDLTSCVDKNTWFDHLEIRSDHVINISGMSRTASELPSQLMRCAKLQKVAFQGGVQPDRESGMDRFSITAIHRLESDK